MDHGPSESGLLNAAGAPRRRFKVSTSGGADDERPCKMRDAHTLRDSLERLGRCANAALRTPVCDGAWQELVRTILSEKAVLDVPLESVTTDALRSQVIADAECISASLVATRCQGTRLAATAERHLVNYCQNMKSGIEALLSELRPRTGSSPNAQIVRPLRQI